MRPFWFTLSALALLAGTIQAQEYRWEQNDKLRIKFKVHTKLAAVPLQIGQVDPHTKVKYEPDDDGDYIRGQYSWEFYVLEFPKQSAKKPVPAAADGNSTTTEAAPEHEADNPLRSADFRQWVTEKDPGIKDRTYKEKAKPMRGRGKTPDYEYWEYSDSDPRSADLFWYNCAAVYDLPERQIVLRVQIPAINKPEPKSKYIKWAMTMIGSLEIVDVADINTADGPDEDRDHFANTPERQQELAKAKGNIANLEGWDYFTSPNYICLYSWEPDKPDKRKPATKFAHDIVDQLETMRELYTKEFPPHDHMLQLYSIVRICNNYDDFFKYSGMRGGVVGYFSPASKELVLFDDKDRYFGNKRDTIYSTAMHEGWHQYGHTYFGEKAELHRWFDEGMGDYFGSWEKKGKKWVYTVSKDRFRGVREQVARGNYINPRELVSWERSKFYGSPRVVDHYEQSYSIIDFLKRGPEVLGKKFDPLWATVLDKYRVAMLETKDQKKSVEKAYEGVDWTAFEEAWIDWVKNHMK
jgi:hypothetical protein